MSDQDRHLESMNRFIALANEMKGDGVPTHVVSWAMMTASAVYATYSVAGNTGGLNPSGIDKLADSYKQCLMQVQDARKDELRAKGADIENEQS